MENDEKKIKRADIQHFDRMGQIKQKEKSLGYQEEKVRKLDLAKN